MVKITYDENNKEHCKLIEDFYFYKYYRSVLLFDWEKTYKENIIDTDIIVKHLNKIEFNRFCEIHLRIIDNKNIKNIKKIKLKNIINEIFDSVFYSNPHKIYLYFLVHKFFDTDYENRGTPEKAYDDYLEYQKYEYYYRKWFE